MEIKEYRKTMIQWIAAVVESKERLPGNVENKSKIINTLVPDIH